MLDRILPTCHTLKVMVEDELLHSVNAELLLKSSGNTTNVLLSDKEYAVGVLEYLCEIAAQSNRQLVVCLFVGEGQTIDLSDALYHCIKELHIISTGQTGTGTIVAKNLSSSSFLTQLSVIGHVKCQLKNLFNKKAVLTYLTYLNLCDCNLDKKDLEALCFASNKGLFPNLVSLGLSLSLSDRDSSLVARLFRPAEKNIFTQNWEHLTSLSVKSLTNFGFTDLLNGIGQRKLTNLRKLCLLMMQNETCNLEKLQLNKLPHLEHLSVQRCVTSKENLKQVSRMLTHWTLQTLDISHSRGITGELSTLASQDLRSLRNLVLHDCELNDKDMESLAKANEKGMLLNLENLDLSENYYLTAKFGAYSSQWFNLRKLKINNQHDTSSSSLEVGVLPVHLPVIKELRIAGKNSIHIWRGCWEHVEKLDIVESASRLKETLPTFLKAVEKGDFPALQTVCLLPCGGHSTILDDNLTKLSEKGINICVVDLNLEKVIVDADLMEVNRGQCNSAISLG